MGDNPEVAVDHKVMSLNAAKIQISYCEMCRKKDLLLLSCPALPGKAVVTEGL